MAPGLPKVTLRQIPGVQGALICMDPTTGRVLAMVGGFSFDQSQFNRATQAMRQPGSSIKPMVYLTALEEGISPNQMISNSELSIQVGNTLWEPENSTGTFGGAGVDEDRAAVLHERADGPAGAEDRHAGDRRTRRSRSTCMTHCRMFCRRRSARWKPRRCAKSAPMPGSPLAARRSFRR